MFAIDDQALLSGRLDHYFRYAAWAVVVAFFACVYLLYCYYLSLTNTTSPLQHVSIQVLLCIFGAAGAIGGTFLSKGMWTYWRQYDTSSKGSKRLWFFIMSFLFVFGCAAYYFLVYASQVRRHTSE